MEEMKKKAIGKIEATMDEEYKRGRKEAIKEVLDEDFDLLQIEEILSSGRKHETFRGEVDSYIAGFLKELNEIHMKAAKEEK